MKKYVTPASCVLSVKMDENIASSNFYFPLRGDYIRDQAGKIQNTPLDYSAAVANASNPFALFYHFLITWDVKEDGEIAELTKHVYTVSTACYVPGEEV